MLRPKHRSGVKPARTDRRGPQSAERLRQSFLEWSAVHGLSAQNVEPEGVL